MAAQNLSRPRLTDTEHSSAECSASPEPNWRVLGRENQSKAPGLPQSEITGNEEDYHHKTNNVDYTVHVSSFFLSRDRIYFILELDLIPSHEALRCSIRQFEKEYLEVP